MGFDRKAYERDRHLRRYVPVTGPTKGRKVNSRGLTLRPDGYVWRLIYPENPLYCMAMGKQAQGRYVQEHRLRMAEHIGRPLTAEEVVHHENEVKDDNRIENLVLFPDESAHQAHHHELGTGRGQGRRKP